MSGGGSLESAGSFERWWSHPGDWVEQPNLRRGGQSGVKRVQVGARWVYVKQQVGHLYRSLRHPFGRPTVLRERDALRRIAALGVRVPRLTYCAAVAGERWQALLVTEELEGFQDLDSWYASGARDRHGEALHERLLQRLGETLARLHRGRWQHGCLYGKHVFVKVRGEGAEADVEVALLDLEKSRRRLSRARAARHDLAQLRRHAPLGASDWQRFERAYRAHWLEA